MRSEGPNGRQRHPRNLGRGVRATRERRRARDVAIFLVLRYTGMRLDSVATLRVRNLAPRLGLRGVVVKGGKTRDIPLPTGAGPPRAFEDRNDSGVRADLTGRVESSRQLLRIASPGDAQLGGNVAACFGKF